jgi:hypothetical protein
LLTISIGPVTYVPAGTYAVPPPAFFAAAIAARNAAVEFAEASSCAP